MTDPAPATAPKVPVEAAPALAAPNGTRVFATPLARRIAATRGLDLSTIRGTGPRGRIVKADVDQAEVAPATPVRARTAAAPRAMTATDTAALYEGRAFTEVALDGMRRTIADRLTEAKQTVPHFYLRRSVVLDPLLATRQNLNSRLADRGLKLSVNDFVIKAVAGALIAVPDANAVWAGDRILRFAAADVAVAVAIEGGLFTPVLRDADSKGLAALSTEMRDLADRARKRRLAPQDYQGGSFAISNLGMYGVESFDAVINPPHAGILAVGAGMAQPIVKADGSVGAATVMQLGLSCDHRVLDGALGAQLLDAICARLEEPTLMLV